MKKTDEEILMEKLKEVFPKEEFTGVPVKDLIHQDMFNALLSAMQAAREDELGKWIEADKELPKSTNPITKYIVADSNGTLSSLYYYDNGIYGVGFYNSALYSRNINITHWMPLPTAPSITKPKSEEV